MSVLAHAPDLSFVLLSCAMEYSVLGLVKVGVPALRKLLHVLIRVGVWDLLLWRIVVEDLLGLFLCGDHAFDFVENVLIDVDE